MNRHARRAVAKNKRLVASLDDISGAAEKLQPFVTQIEKLQAQLAAAAELVSRTRAENETLMSALSMQQAVYYRLFAQGMGVSLDTVISLAAGIQAQLSEGDTDGIEDPETGSKEAGDSSP